MIMRPTLSARMSPAGSSFYRWTNGACKLAAPNPQVDPTFLLSRRPPLPLIHGRQELLGEGSPLPRNERLRASGNGGASLRDPPPPAGFIQVLPPGGGLVKGNKTGCWQGFKACSDKWAH